MFRNWLGITEAYPSDYVNSSLDHLLQISFLYFSVVDKIKVEGIFSSILRSNKVNSDKVFKYSSSDIYFLLSQTKNRNC